MKRVMGFWRSWGLVIGVMIGNGIFMLPAVLAPYGALSVAGWVVAGMGTVFIALMLGMLARRFSLEGGLYAYTREVFGDLAGFLIAWGYWISILAAVPAGAIAATGYMSFFIPVMAEQAFVSASVALILIWLATAINISGVKTASTFQLITSLLKLLPLLVIAVGGLLLGDISNTVVENTTDRNTLFLISEMVMITMWAYVGIEAITLPADDVIEPEKNIPRALIAGTLTATVVYIILSWGVMTLVPVGELAQSSSPLAAAASVILGPWGAGFIAVGALVSIISNLNGNVFIVGIMPRVLSQDGLFPRRFTRLNANDIPATAVVFSGFISSMLVVMNYSEGLVGAFKALIMLSTLAVLLPYTVCSLAELVMQRKDRRSGTKIKPASTLIALVALAFSLFAIVGSGAMVALQGGILLAAGLPVYWWSKRQRAPVTP
ncbi:MAG: amino acid permease [Arenicella sp.]|nr:amino acid permease [Arenicella sp.]